MTVKDRIIATARTAAAGLIAYVLTWAAVHLHIILSPGDSVLVQGVVFTVLLAVYHAAASWLQRQWPVWSAKLPVLAWLRALVALLLVTDYQPTGYVSPSRAFEAQREARRSPGRRR